MFNCVLKTMCREDWYSFAEETPGPNLLSNDELSLATTI
jgi:hypothetical protein